MKFEFLFRPAFLKDLEGLEALAMLPEQIVRSFPRAKRNLVPHAFSISTFAAGKSRLRNIEP